MAAIDDIFEDLFEEWDPGELDELLDDPDVPEVEVALSYKRKGK